jgi:hypothetical protein
MLLLLGYQGNRNVGFPFSGKQFNSCHQNPNSAHKNKEARLSKLAAAGWKQKFVG